MKCRKADKPAVGVCLRNKRILSILSEKPTGPKSIAKKLNLAASTVRKELLYLESLNFIKCGKRGRDVGAAPKFTRRQEAAYSLEREGKPIPSGKYEQLLLTRTAEISKKERSVRRAMRKELRRSRACK